LVDRVQPAADEQHEHVGDMFAVGAPILDRFELVDARLDLLDHVAGTRADEGQSGEGVDVSRFTFVFVPNAFRQRVGVHAEAAAMSLATGPMSGRNLSATFSKSILR